MSNREMFILLIIWTAVAIIGISIVDARLIDTVKAYEGIYGR